MKRLLAASILILACALVGASQTLSSQDQDQITEVTLERTACFGTCPIYKVTVRRDGTISYEGKRFVQLEGSYKGTTYGFDRLAQLISSQGYFNFKDDYSINATDLPTAITSVVSGGKRKTIRNYGDAGPVELWGIEMAIDGMLKSARLEKVKGPRISRRK